ncbi:MAG: hypothetical protein KC776_31830 [Myxococcales bacterium]|nr:hypothetical protein [Myxococcales bacterium]MCB9583228.1 hypothetical protein [Polyangiaceae bacterium]
MRARSLIVGVALAGCASSTTHGYPGASVVAEGAPTRRAAKPRPVVRWSALDDAESWPSVNDEPFTSRGHAGGRWTLSVRVSPNAREAYAALRPGAVMPEGAVIAAFHQDATRGKPGPIYVMEKKGGDWRFSRVRADGRVQEGSVALCARCHAEAVADHLFGLPRGESPKAGDGSNP